jgi:hypothetical protein
VDEGDLWQAIMLLMYPRRVVLNNCCRYFREQIAEIRKHPGERAPVSIPSDPWSPSWLAWSDLSTDSGRWEKMDMWLGMLHVAASARQFFLKNGQYPASLGEIPTSSLPQVPVDLWGHRIAYRLKAGQPVIYSLGPDGIDDGGRPTDPIALTPSSRGDLVFGKLTRRLKPR